MWASVGGVISLLLIFPVLLLGARFANASPIEKSRQRRLTAVIVLGISIFILAIFPFLSPFAILIVFFYAILSSIHIVRMGQGFKRFLIGPAVAVLVVFCLVDYAASITVDLSSHMAANESAAVGVLRAMVTAENNSAKQTSLEGSGRSSFATIHELRKSALLDVDLIPGEPHAGYLFRESVTPDRQQFLFYAIPAQYHPEGRLPEWTRYVPGGAWLRAWRREAVEGSGVRSFCVDETGVIRFSITLPKIPVTREQAAQWSPI